ncbi:hypothetical protein JST56_06675 [Candidatus Dependentiae bacterium]|nr:hypothetical protein [Candidatus Dependentiae bacterium]
MRILLHHWIKSLYFFTPGSLKTMLLRSAWVYGAAMSLMIINFYWLLLAEGILFATVVGTFTRLAPSADKTVTLPAGLIIISFILSVIGLVANSALLLFIRKEEPFSPAISYFKYYFFRYLQFSMFIFGLTLLGLCILLSMGITKLPSFPAPITLTVRVLELLTAFYWLDSHFTLKDVFISVEKSINLLVYNLPVFVALLSALWALEFGIGLIVFGSNPDSGLSSITLSQRIEITNLAKTGMSTVAMVTFKYLRFIFEYLWISVIFCVYRQRRDVKYSTSFFEQEANQE